MLYRLGQRAYVFPGVVINHAPDKGTPTPKPVFSPVCKSCHCQALGSVIISALFALKKEFIQPIENSSWLHHIKAAQPNCQYFMRISHILQA